MYSAMNRHIGPLLASIAKDGGLDQYKYLIDTFRHTDTTRDEQFQRVYRSYWQMGTARLSDGFCNAYFGLLEESKAFERTDVDSVAIRLFNIASKARESASCTFPSPRRWCTCSRLTCQCTTASWRSFIS
jgi:hypothetical protein